MTCVFWLVRNRIGPEDSDEIELIIEGEGEGRKDVHISLLDWDLVLGNLNQQGCVSDEHSQGNQEKEDS